MKSVEISRQGLQFLKTCPAHIGFRIHTRIRELAQDPFSGDIQKLAGIDNTYRTRVGHSRIIFTFDQDTLSVTTIKNRENAYS
jgi:mRNA-degrading endonuclease RelE of RelBE toxin-antitoxin system